jgi:hypothetical protein
MDKNAAISACFETHRLCAGIYLSASSLGLAQTYSGKSVVDMPTPADQRGGEHDFDFEFGT